jgi:Cu-Zn family superoxide dismutase
MGACRLARTIVSRVGKCGQDVYARLDPFEMRHGGPKDFERHVGDLGNIRSDADGVAKIDFSDSGISLLGPFSVIG